MITHNDFMILLYEVANDVSQELDERKSGKSGSGSVEDLEFIFVELTSLGSSLLDSTIEPFSERKHLKSAAIVMESWPAQEDLGEKICMIDFLYRNELSVSDS